MDGWFRVVRAHDSDMMVYITLFQGLFRLHRSCNLTHIARPSLHCCDFRSTNDIVRLQADISYIWLALGVDIAPSDPPRYACLPFLFLCASGAAISIVISTCKRSHLPENQVFGQSHETTRYQTGWHAVAYTLSPRLQVFASSPHSSIAFLLSRPDGEIISWLMPLPQAQLNTAVCDDN